jgi:hypothetical protein
MRKVAIIGIALAAAGSAFAQPGGGPFRATLTGYQEVPAVSSPADGEFMARVDREGTVDWQLSYEGLQGNVTQAHLHFAQTGVSGPIVVWLCATEATIGNAPAGFTTLCPQSGTLSGTFTSADVRPAAAQLLAQGELNELIAAMRAGAVYVNVHTSAVPAGEIRGQIGGRGHSGNIHNH